MGLYPAQTAVTLLATGSCGELTELATVPPSEVSDVTLGTVTVAPDDPAQVVLSGRIVCSSGPRREVDVRLTGADGVSTVATVRPDGTFRGSVDNCGTDSLRVTVSYVDEVSGQTVDLVSATASKSDYDAGDFELCKKQGGPVNTDNNTFTATIGPSFWIAKVGDVRITADSSGLTVTDASTGGNEFYLRAVTSQADFPRVGQFQLTDGAVFKPFGLTDTVPISLVGTTLDIVEYEPAVGDTPTKIGAKIGPFDWLDLYGEVVEVNILFNGFVEF